MDTELEETDVSNPFDGARYLDETDECARCYRVLRASETIICAECAAIIAEWQIAPIDTPGVTLGQLRTRYEEARAWELRCRTALDQHRHAYVSMLLSGQPGDKADLRARARLWRKALRGVQRTEAALTGRLLQAEPDTSIP